MHPEIEKLFNLAAKKALVTGAGAGIGLAVARTFAASGAAVIVADIDEGAARKAADDIVRDYQRRTLAIRTDVADERSVIDTVSRAADEFGGFDILVNNAGIYPNATIAEAGVEMWDRVMAVNLRGVFLCTREAARVMASAGKGGRIVNISSTESFHPTFPGLGHYGASKAAINTFTKTAALEYAPAGILVNAVCPGGTLTPGTRDGFENRSMRQFLEARVPLRRVATPEEIAAAVLFLASPAASYVTGTTLLVDGGYLIS